MGKAFDPVVAIVHGHRHAAGLPEVADVVGLRWPAFRREGDLVLAIFFDADVRGTVLVSIHMPRDDDGLCPTRNDLRDGLGQNRGAEIRAFHKRPERGAGRAERALAVEHGGALPHPPQGLLVHKSLVDLHRGALDTDLAPLDGRRRFECHCVLGLDAVLDGQVEVLHWQVHIREDQLLLDELPNSAGRLVAIELDDRVAHVDFVRHGCDRVCPLSLPLPTFEAA
mmetsp:Transcript_9098/g.27285  ORF Transcript_9098/g.27285 Transcript_9098/m.27285 type:complete len:225 (-) Transcript_9098:13-687(-)